MRTAGKDWMDRLQGNDHPEVSSLPLMLMESKEKKRAKAPPRNTSNSLPLLLPLLQCDWRDNQKIHTREQWTCLIEEMREGPTWASLGSP